MNNRTEFTLSPTAEEYYKEFQRNNGMADNTISQHITVFGHLKKFYASYGHLFPVLGIFKREELESIDQALPTEITSENVVITETQEKGKTTRLIVDRIWMTGMLFIILRVFHLI